MNPETKRVVIRWLLREIIGGSVFVGLCLFIPAGTLNWPMGWALIGVYLTWTAATALLIIPRCPELLVERMSRPKNTKRWDMALMSVIGLLTLVRYIVAGLDFRNGWTSGLWPVPVALQIAGLVIAVLAYALTTWAMTVNAYFSKIVRIQDERGHSVATDGPYQVVRHPGYLGTLAFELGTSIMLGSLWALVLSIVSVVLFIVRTALEDRMLQDELAGYAEYAKQVRYRLIPGVW